ncbi:amino acid ABC transporter permease [Neorhizobium sp. NCHU2750]|uniref:amino acid ABC transporter permease n=1 Tax=Neorhizobium sp. NCHU2750 TaxID=1825976 RepID=UPI000E732096|nr:amino acid ABC transporter permease [Neorhizobium sp. NCHU2750]
MGTYHFDFSIVAHSLPFLLQGLWMSLWLTVVSGVIGLIAGFLVCLLATSSFPPLRWVAVLYIELFRCTPALIQLIWIFYCVPLLFNIAFDPVPMAILALSLNITAFNAEAYRAAIQAIPSAHMDACTAIGLSSFQRTVYVILPQAVIAAIPVLVTNTIGLLQQTALVAVVGIADLMYQGKTLASQNYRPIETFTAVALIYFCISLPTARLVGYLEKRIRFGAARG